MILSTICTDSETAVAVGAKANGAGEGNREDAVAVEVLTFCLICIVPQLDPLTIFTAVVVFSLPSLLPLLAVLPKVVGKAKDPVAAEALPKKLTGLFTGADDESPVEVVLVEVVDMTNPLVELADAGALVAVEVDEEEEGRSKGFFLAGAP